MFICVGLVLAIAGCGGPSEERKRLDAATDEVRAVAEKFLAAIESGDAATALSLTVLDDDDPAVCEEALEHYDQVSGRPQRATVVDAAAGGEDLEVAGAEVTYQQGSEGKEFNVMLQMVPREGSYAIDLSSLLPGASPVGVSLANPGVPGEGVGRLRALSFTIDGQCEIVGSSGHYTMLPGNYTIGVADPGGLAAEQSFEVTSGLDSTWGDSGLSENYTLVPPYLAAETLAEVDKALNALAAKCVESRLTDPTCPASARAVADQVPDTEECSERTPGPRPAVLAQDWAGNWQVTSHKEPFSYKPGPICESVAGVYSGTVRRDGTGSIVIDLDAPSAP